MTNDVFQYKNLNLDTLYPVSTLAAKYVKQSMPDCKKVWMLGSDSMKDELEAFGLNVIGGASGTPEFDDPKTALTPEKIDEYPLDEDVDVVVSGLDFTANYSKLLLTSLYI